MASVKEALSLTLREVDPVRSSEWASLVAKNPSTVFHSPQWMEVIEKTYGLDFSALVLESDGQPVAGAAWSEVSDLLGTRRISLPFSDLGDLIVSGPDDAALLIDLILSAGTPWSLRTFARNKPIIDLPVKTKADYKWHGVRLDEAQQVLWDRMSSMAQRGIRKAERGGVEVVTASTQGQLREWFLLHMRLRREKFALLAQPYDFMKNIWDTFMARDQGFLLLATHQGRIIAGTLFLMWKDTCYYKFNASEGASLELRPNNLLMWQGMLEAKQRGAKLLDLGRSSSHQEGLLGFKRGFGAIEEDLLTLTYNAPVDEPKEVADNRTLFKDLTGLFVDASVPESTTERAGSLLYKYFV